jgi:hypothetical protein
LSGAHTPRRGRMYKTLQFCFLAHVNGFLFVGSMVRNENVFVNENLRSQLATLKNSSHICPLRHDLAVGIYLSTPHVGALPLRFREGEK